MSRAKPTSPALQRGGPLASGLVLGTPLHEGSGPTAHDLAGSGRDGSLSSGATWTDGPVGRCLSLNGSSGYVTSACPSPSSLTLAFWCRPARNFNYEVWVDTYASGSSTKDARLYSDNTGTITVDLGGAGGFSSASGVMTTGVWHHLALTRKSGANTLYIDGVQQGSNTNGGPGGTTTNLYWGQGADGFPCSGLIDGLALWSVCLTAEQVRLHLADSWRLYRRRAWILAAPAAGGTNGNASPGLQTAAWSAPAVTATGGASATAGSQSAAWSAPSTAETATAQVTTTQQSAAWSAPAPSPTADASVATTQQPAAWSAPSVVAGVLVTANAGSQSASWSAPSATVTADAIIAANASAAFSAPPAGVNLTATVTALVASASWTAPPPNMNAGDCHLLPLMGVGI